MRPTVLEVLLVVSAIAYVLVCPYTKVEESFNVQATHDILIHRDNIGAYDHHTFPGVVPRTFVGSLVLAALSFPFHYVLEALSLPKWYSLVAVRATLAVVSTGALIFLSRAIRDAVGPGASRAFKILHVVQFHVLFYASRALSNTFALIIVLIALGVWMRSRPYLCLTMLGFGGALFRSELLVYAAPLGLCMVLKRHVSLMRGVTSGLIGVAIAIGISVVVDSFFWQRLIWPEGHVFYYNVVLNKSHNWGVMPPHWYFTSALPRAMGSTLLFLPMALFSEHSARVMPFAVIAIAFVLLYSLLPHKELRFIFYAIPTLNIAAADVLGSAITKRRVRPFRYFLALLVVGCSVAISLVMLSASYHNYPAGNALHHVNYSGHFNSHKPLAIHIDAAAAMSGVSLYLHEHPNWTYSKDESKDLDFQQFDVLITERESVPGFRMWHVQHGFDHLDLSVEDNSIGIRTRPMIFVHEKN